MKFREFHAGPRGEIYGRRVKTKDKKQGTPKATILRGPGEILEKMVAKIAAILVAEIAMVTLFLGSFQ